MAGDPWQYREQYIENSPFFYFDRVRTSLLLRIGMLDTAVSAFGSEISAGLSALARAVTYAKYDGGWRGLSSWTEVDRSVSLALA
jgi:dipeptidyl aminopeptidase/acylaminoacyl peptidase